MLHGRCDASLSITFANSSTCGTSFKLLSLAAIVMLGNILAAELWTFGIVLLMLL